MAKLADRISAEIDNIQRILERFPKLDKLHKLSALELAGVAALLHNFYNGIENILKQIVLHKGLAIPKGQSWHRDLLDLALFHKIISQSTGKSLMQYLAFRHFFSHGYALDIDPERIRPLVQSIHKILKSFLRNIKRFESRS